MKQISQSATVEHTRKNLKDAFWILLQDKKIEKISVRELVHLAGYNRTTFYNYYQDIFDLLEDVENDILDEVDLCFSIIFEKAKMEDLIEKAFEIFFNQREYLHLLLGTNGDSQFRNKLKRRFKVIFRRFIKLTLKSDVVLEYKLEFYSSGIVSVLEMWLINGELTHLKEFSRSIGVNISL